MVIQRNRVSGYSSAHSGDARNPVRAAWSKVCPQFDAGPMLVLALRGPDIHVPEASLLAQETGRVGQDTEIG